MVILMWQTDSEKYSYILERIPGGRRITLNKEGPLCFIVYVSEEKYLDGPDMINGIHVEYRLA